MKKTYKKVSFFEFASENSKFGFLSTEDGGTLNFRLVADGLIVARILFDTSNKILVFDERAEEKAERLAGAFETTYPGQEITVSCQYRK